MFDLKEVRAPPLAAVVAPLACCGCLRPPVFSLCCGSCEWTSLAHFEGRRKLSMCMRARVGSIW